jgi:4-carboxymuconolactone decarboxylase
MMKRFGYMVCSLLAMLMWSLDIFAQQDLLPGSSLSPKQESIVPIAAYTANGDQAGLKKALTGGLNAGLTVNELKEILVQLYAYAGFPRSLNAISTLQGLLNERKQSGINDVMGKRSGKGSFQNGKFAFGKDVQTKLTGSTATGSAQTFVPLIDTLLKEHLFADIFSRDILDFKTREIATISALASLGGAEAQLRGHLGVGRNVGLSEGQLRRIANKLSVVVDKDAGEITAKLLDGMFSNAAAASASAPVVVSMKEPTFAKGNKVSNGNFTGNVWVNMLTSVDTANSTSVGNVTFAPKARSNWHRHPSGQILLVTDGLGYYQEKGQPVRLIRKGDVIKCPPNIAHWHGASRDNSMTHVTLGPDNGKGPVEGLSNVTDEEYNQLK